MNRRRARRNPLLRLRPFWIAIVLAGIGGAVGLFYAAQWEGFRVKRIDVTGTNVVSREEVLQRAAIDPAVNLWLQSMGAAANRIREIPYVKSVAIRRRLPATAEIEITEREPFAIVAASGAPRLLVDADLRVLETETRRRALPVLIAVEPRDVSAGTFLSDPKSRALLNDYAVLRENHVEPQLLRFDSLGDLSIVLPPAIAVQLGDDQNLGEKAALIDPILSQTQAQGRRVARLDLRAPKTPVIVFR
ncbi:MAG: FtsQ-type POTRA domain-containing protein [Candidatus Eremiobacteraeota bacterium]|nr:FtsQ-type POTRA domain-containing protein [Candidatus Eremiobacteraeota bacterium]